MEIIIKFIGIFLVSLAVCFLMRPELILNVSQFIAKGSRIYFVGGIRLFLAVIFLLSARGCSKPLIIGAIGAIFLISGAYIFGAGADKMRSIIDWFQKRPLWLLRFFSAVLFILGCLIIYAA